jgi:hypothetical protein
VPEEYWADLKSQGVKLRKRRLEEQQAFDNYCGCKKFTMRQHYSHQHQAKENANVVYHGGNQTLRETNRRLSSSPRGTYTYAEEGSPFLSKKDVAPFLNDQEETAAAREESDLIARNNQLKQKAYLDHHLNSTH